MEITNMNSDLKNRCSFLAWLEHFRISIVLGGLCIVTLGLCPSGPHPRGWSKVQSSNFESKIKIGKNKIFMNFFFEICSTVQNHQFTPTNNIHNYDILGLIRIGNWVFCIFYQKNVFSGAFGVREWLHSDINVWKWLLSLTIISAQRRKFKPHS